MSSKEESTDRVIKAGENAPSKSGQALGTAVPESKMRIACILAYCLPGAGHIVLGRWQRGLVFMSAILLMFVLGLVMHGHLYSPQVEDKVSFFLTLGDIGVGLPYFLTYLIHSMHSTWNLGWGAPQVEMATYEYGNVFLWTAGLLNTLVVLDAYDIAIGRKQ